jgi:hypothetical protein
MRKVLTGMPDEALLAVYRVAKTRLAAFFRDPRNMIALRDEIRRRKLS